MVGSTVLALIVYLPALALGVGTGYVLFRSMRGTCWPGLAGRYAAAALATIAGLSAFLMFYWVLGLTGVFSHGGRPTSARELLIYALVVGPIYAAAVVLRYTRLGRRLSRPIRWRRGA